jgi:AraC family transcriptional regulator
LAPFWREARERRVAVDPVPIRRMMGAKRLGKGDLLDNLITPDEVPRYVPGALTMDSAPLGWDGVRVRGWRYTGLDVQVPGLSDYLIVVCQEGTTPYDRRCTGEWRSDLVTAGSTSLMTRAAPSHWRWSGDVSVIQLYLSPFAVKDVAAQAYERHVREVELHDVTRADDPVLFGVAALLAQEARHGGLGGRLYVESLRTQVCLHVLRHYASVAFREESSHGGLSRAQCRLLDEFIDENLDRDISLADLAGVVQLSTLHFTRKFRAEFGCPPHSYVIRKRMEHAMRQIAQPDIPLKVVAASCGFCDQSHMNRLFRRVLGVTPAEYRRSRTA